MNGSKRQRRYIHKHAEAMLRCLRSFAVSGNKEDLHRLRLEAKKLKSDAVFFQSWRKSNGFEKKIGPLKKIFKYAGMIRDAQVNLELMEEYQIQENECKEEQMNIISKISGKFYMNREKYSRQIRKIKKNFPASIPDKDQIKDKYKNEVNKIASFFVVPIDNTHLHAARKKIKTLVYVFDIIPHSLQKELPLDTGYLKKLEQGIGKWHDMSVAAQLLETRNSISGHMLSGLRKDNLRALDSVQSLGWNFAVKAWNG